MRIVQPGKYKDGQWTGEFDCTGNGNGNQGCGARLEITEDDLYSVQSHARTETTNYISFMCPCCGEETDLYRDEGYRHPDFPAPLARRGGFPYAGPDKRKQAQASIKAGNYVNPGRV